MIQREIRYYSTSEDRIPFREWFYSLKDKVAQAAIRLRLERVSAGLLGVYRPVGGGVWELKFYLGPGYRIYFGEDGSNIIVLLAGGDKDSQARDVKRAQTFWVDHRRRKHEGK